MWLRLRIASLLVAFDDPGVQSELDAHEGYQLVDSFERILLWKAARQLHEAELVGEAQSVVIATAAVHFRHVGGAERGPLSELLAAVPTRSHRKHRTLVAVCSTSMATRTR